MDFLVKHWTPFPRRFPSPFPVNSFDCIPHKSTWVRHPFQTCNFSFILRGQGVFHRLGRAWEVKAPCVITQWPGEFIEYGPLPDETWEEFYIIYPGRLMSRFRQSQLIDPALPVWPIAAPEGLEPLFAELQRISRCPAPERVVDRVDRVCERLILESRLPQESPSIRKQTPIEALISEMRSNPGAPLDFSAIAAKNGMSPATFRRRWSEFNPTPPAHFLQQLRMREACRLLVETKQPIYEIAHSIGFEDELYFSRCFAKAMKLSPRAYRQAHPINTH